MQPTIQPHPIGKIEKVKQTSTTNFTIHKQFKDNIYIYNAFETNSKETKYQCPDRIHKDEDDSNGVWNATGFGEGVSESTRGSDVFLQQIAWYDQTDCFSDGVAPHGACK